MREILVLGAGSSLAEAQRQHAALVPPLDRGFFSTARSLKPAPVELATVTDYMSSKRIDIYSTNWDSMERVLAFIQSECEQMGRKAGVNVTAFRALLSLYRRTLNDSTVDLRIDSGTYIRRWIERTFSQGRSANEVAVVTFNHDLLAERSVYDLDRSLLALPFCYETELAQGTPAGEGRVERFDVPLVPPAEYIRFYKLHGSLNWLSLHDREAVPYTDLTGSARQVKWTARTAIPAQMTIAGGSRTRKHTLPVVVPPFRNKGALMPKAIKKIWRAAELAFKGVEEVTFFGYSCPNADTEAEGLFRRALADSPSLQRINIVNPDLGAVGRFAEFVPGRGVYYYPNADAWLKVHPSYEDLLQPLRAPSR